MNSYFAQRPRVLPTSSASAREGGFTLIEVLISLIILSVGLLGLGLLQADSLKSSFSADQRTAASSLAYQMVDMMRANRLLAYQYSYASGQQGTQTAGSCSQTPTSGTVVENDVAGWLCQLNDKLPPPVSYAPPNPSVTLVNGLATVSITWSDRGPTGAPTNTTFTVASEL